MTLAIEPVLGLIEEGAASADETRSVATSVISAIKANPIMTFTASPEIGGLNETVVRCGLELESVAARCASTAWVLWNHMCTFHLFAGLLGPDHADQLRRVVAANEWVCFPAGASTGVKAVPEGEAFHLEGKAAFGSGARYAEFAGVTFVPEGESRPSFALVDLRSDGVAIDADWFAMSLRASATDTVFYNGVKIRQSDTVPFHFRYREVFRDLDHPMIHRRYREDWVALSDLWLGMMAAGLLQAALDDVSSGIRDRIAIAGVKVAERPTVHVNLGLAQAKVSAARDTVLAACRETDERIAASEIPTETDYLRQLAASMAALQLCDEAMRLLQRVMGGNGLREGTLFERRLRDFQAMPLHINVHQDRVSEQYGRHVLGLPTENAF